MSAGQQLGVDMATNFMLMTLFTLIADMGENPDGFRTTVKKALCDLSDDYKLPGVAPEIATEARDAAKQVGSRVGRSSGQHANVSQKRESRSK